VAQSIRLIAVSKYRSIAARNIWHLMARIIASAGAANQSIIMAASAHGGVALARARQAQAAIAERGRAPRRHRRAAEEMKKAGVNASAASAKNKLGSGVGIERKSRRGQSERKTAGKSAKRRRHRGGGAQAGDSWAATR